MFCVRCGYVLPEGADRCPGCQAAVFAAPPAAEAFLPAADGEALPEAVSGTVDYTAPPGGAPVCPEPPVADTYAAGYGESPVMPESPGVFPPAVGYTVQPGGAPVYPEPPMTDTYAAGYGESPVTPGVTGMPESPGAFPPAVGYIAPPGGAPAYQEPLKKKKKSKAPVIVAAVLVVVIVAAVGVPLLIRQAKQSRFDEAAVLMADGRYQEALDEFTALADFEAAEDMADHCRNALSYEGAEALMESGDYAAAAEAFAAIGGFEDADERKAECDNRLLYEDADALYLAGDYSGALAIYEQLSGFEDADLQAEYCAGKIAYADAESAFAAGLYYTAYKGFEALGDFEDAAERKRECAQPFPETGETFHDGGYVSGASSLVINTPDDANSRNYLKIYTDGGVLVSCIAIDTGESARVELPAGIYQIKSAHGSGGWYGEEEMFGDSGEYEVLTFDDEGSSLFTFLYNYQYTLSLRGASGASGDAVDTVGEDRENF